MLENQANPQGLNMDDEDILREMEKRINENLMILQDWREIEVRESFAVYEGDQWIKEDIERQSSNAMPQITINRVKPVIKSIIGFGIQNALDIKYVARLNNPEQSGFKDVMNNAVRYIEQSTDAQMAYNLAMEDMFVCGVGATDTVFDYNKPPHNGDFKVERVFPAFLFWDPAARAKNLMDSDYVVRLKVVNRDIIRQEYNIEYYDDIYSSALDARILEFFSAVLAVKQLGVVYEYQFRKKVPFYRVNNPFKDLIQNPQSIMQVAESKGLTSPDAMMMFGQMFKATVEYYSEKFGFVATTDKMFTIEDTKEFAEFNKSLQYFGLKTTKVKQFRYKYYRSLSTGGKIISKSENYSQEGFSIKFMTGEFSELTQYNYGLLRACKAPQRLLNQAVSDYEGFLATIPKGGVNIESDAVEDIQAFINTYAKAKYVTVFKPGAFAAGKMQPKTAQMMPDGLLQMITYADQQIMQVCGVTPELMGMMDSKEQNSGYYRQLIKQGLTTLSTYFDARRSYLMEQARLYIDCVRILCENDEGRMIQNVIGEDKAEYVSLLKNNIADEYDVIIDEQPTSPDEKQNTFEKLLELQMQMMQLPNPTNIMPLVLEYAPFDEKIQSELKELIQPPPPPEPDPMNQKLLESEINFKNSAAQKQVAEAQQIMHKIGGGEQEGRDYLADKKTIADINLTDMKSLAELAKIDNMSHDQMMRQKELILNNKLKE